ncbi:LytR/AlgR family response regulator transcription factor [Aquimarina longa]|uniref:LytR/AlgR family response regulator transcription factor n=1 Tax=Aquimarina longa TaxID=1080221 RepID=UPI00130E203E|nr:LytTR family DNA-binding domain-containing protein [Aquimarina longa]
MKIKCLLLDDDSLSLYILKKHLESFENYEVVSTCHTPSEAFDMLSKHSIDLIFVDIHMPQINGLEFIKKLKKPPILIIVTSDPDFAVQGFELGVIDYLIKPIHLGRLAKSLNKVSRMLQNNETLKEYLNQQSEDHIFIKVDKKMIKIPIDEILYIESLKDYVSIKTVSKNYVTHYNLAAITRLLPEYLFMRIHRSYTIAINKVKAISKNCIEIDNKSIPIGRNYIKTVKGKIINGGVVNYLIKD